MLKLAPVYRASVWWSQGEKPGLLIASPVPQSWEQRVAALGPGLQGRRTPASPLTHCADLGRSLASSEPQAPSLLENQNQQVLEHTPWGGSGVGTPHPCLEG